MIRLLFISFDFFRPGEIRRSYSVASISAYIKNRWEGTDLHIDHYAFDLEQRQYTSRRVVKELSHHLALGDYDFVLLPDYAWSNYLTNDVIRGLRTAGCGAKMIVGGYEVTATPNEAMADDYPLADFCIKGYAEEAVLQAITQRTKDRILQIPVDASCLPSLYLSRELPITADTQMIRWETKRGCPYRCGFCEWSAIPNQEIGYINAERLLKELDLFGRSAITKVNVLDGTFNTGKNYIELFRQMMRYPKIRFHLQTRLEALDTKDGEEFLSLCAHARNVYLECGVQTIIPEEMQLIGRHNNVDKVARMLRKLTDLGIEYETNLIYGIPGQTLETFDRSMDFLMKSGCRADRIRCFPLRIPKASPMREKDPLLVEKPETSRHGKINVVQSSSSFETMEWQGMQFRANFPTAMFPEFPRLLASIGRRVRAHDILSRHLSGFDVLFDDGPTEPQLCGLSRLRFRIPGECSRWTKLTPAAFAIRLPGFLQALLKEIQSSTGDVTFTDWSPAVDLGAVECKLSPLGRKRWVRRIWWSGGKLRLCLTRQHPMSSVTAPTTR